MLWRWAVGQPWLQWLEPRQPRTLRRISLPCSPSAAMPARISLALLPSTSSGAASTDSSRSS